MFWADWPGNGPSPGGVQVEISTTESAQRVERGGGGPEDRRNLRASEHFDTQRGRKKRKTTKKRRRFVVLKLNTNQFC